MKGFSKFVLIVQLSLTAISIYIVEVSSGWGAIDAIVPFGICYLISILYLIVALVDSLETGSIKRISPKSIIDYLEADSAGQKKILLNNSTDWVRVAVLIISLLIVSSPLLFYFGMQ